MAGVSNFWLQQRRDGLFFSFLLFTFSEPVKELRLSFMSGEKNAKYFYYFQGLRAL